MKLNPHIQKIDVIRLELMDELKRIAASVNLDDPNSLTKEEAFLDSCNRYEAETEYFNAEHNFYSGVLPSKDLANRLQSYHDLLTTKYFPNHTIFRSQIVRNVPGGIIHPHIDPRVYHSVSHRVHAVLMTNDSCAHVYFDETTYEAEFIKMDVGFLYDFDNLTPHAAFNLGRTSRLHIISDVIDFTSLRKYERSFRANPNYTAPGTFAKYRKHQNAIDARYGGAQGLKRLYEQSINTE